MLDLSVLKACARALRHSIYRQVDMGVDGSEGVKVNPDALMAVYGYPLSDYTAALAQVEKQIKEIEHVDKLPSLETHVGAQACQDTVEHECMCCVAPPVH